MINICRSADRVDFIPFDGKMSVLLRESNVEADDDAISLSGSVHCMQEKQAYHQNISSLSALVNLRKPSSPLFVYVPLGWLEFVVEFS